MASYTVSLLHPKVIRDLRLAGHGLEIRERPYSNFLPLPDGRALVGGGLERTQAEVPRFSARDAERLPAYYAMLDRVAEVLRALTLETPPNVPFLTLNKKALLLSEIGTGKTISARCGRLTS